MCGRYTLQVPAKIKPEMFGLKQVPLFEPRYHIASTQEVPVVRLNPEQHDREVAFSDGD